jgi:hypothetical protein
MPTYYAEVAEPISVDPNGQFGSEGPSVSFQLDRPRLAGVLVQARAVVADKGIYPFNHAFVSVEGPVTIDALDFYEDQPVMQTSRGAGFPGDQLPFGSFIVVPLEAGSHTLRLTYRSQVTKASFQNRRLWVTIFD